MLCKRQWPEDLGKQQDLEPSVLRGGKQPPAPGKVHFWDSPDVSSQGVRGALAPSPMELL